MRQDGWTGALQKLQDVGLSSPPTEIANSNGRKKTLLFSLKKYLPLQDNSKLRKDNGKHYFKNIVKAIYLQSVPLSIFCLWECLNRNRKNLMDCFRIFAV